MKPIFCIIGLHKWSKEYAISSDRGVQGVETSGRHCLRPDCKIKQQLAYDMLAIYWLKLARGRRI